MGVITWELFLEQLPPATLAQGLKILSEEFASLGVTTFSSRIQFPKIMTGYATLQAWARCRFASLPTMKFTACLLIRDPPDLPAHRSAARPGGRLLLD